MYVVCVCESNGCVYYLYLCVLVTCACMCVSFGNFFFIVLGNDG